MRLDGLRKIILVTIVVVLSTVTIFAASSAISFMISPSKNLQRSSIDNATSLTQLEQGHAHAAFMVFVKDKEIDFSATKYQNQDLLMHFENGSGVILHNYSRVAWLGTFLETLNMTLAKNCLILDNGSSYCSDFDNQVSFVVNGKQNTQFQHYIPKDEDRILISYGKTDQIKSEIDMLNSIVIPET